MTPISSESLFCYLQNEPKVVENRYRWRR